MCCERELRVGVQVSWGCGGCKCAHWGGFTDGRLCLCKCHVACNDLLL